MRVYTKAFVKPVVKHGLEWKIDQWKIVPEGFIQRSVISRHSITVLCSTKYVSVGRKEIFYLTTYSTHLIKCVECIVK